MAEYKCGNCGHPLKVAIHLDKRRASQELKSGTLQSVAPAIPKSMLGQMIHAFRGRSFWPNHPRTKRPEPYVEMFYRLDGETKRDVLTGMTDEEFELVAHAMYQNDWRFSVAALTTYGEFTEYRARELAGKFSRAGLSHVTKQNRTVFRPRTLLHLYRALLENQGAHPTNKEIT